MSHYYSSKAVVGAHTAKHPMLEQMVAFHFDLNLLRSTTATVGHYTADADCCEARLLGNYATSLNCSLAIGLSCSTTVSLNTQMAQAN